MLNNLTNYAVVDDSPAFDDSCATLYPLLFVHGIGGRDRGRGAHWGRISPVLRQHGAQVFFSSHDGWGTLDNNMAQIKQRLDDVLAGTGCAKVNIIAHSKGGLDVRLLATQSGYAKRIASITTLATPHHGSKTMDALIRMPYRVLKPIASSVNLAYRVLGDKNPDFLATCSELSTQNMARFNDYCTDVEGIYYQHFATALRSPFYSPGVSIPYLIVRHFDGENDGIVSVESARYGGDDFKGVLYRPGFTKKRGLSHISLVDWGRRKQPKNIENTPFPLEIPADEALSRTVPLAVHNMVKFYVTLVEDLRTRGL